MLVLTRKIGEEIVIGDGIRVRVLAIKGSHIRLGFEAPPDVLILRTEMVGRRARPGAPEGPPASAPRGGEQKR